MRRRSASLCDTVGPTTRMVALALWVAGCGAAPPAPSSTAHESLAEPSPAEPAPAEPVAFAAAVGELREVPAELAADVRLLSPTEAEVRRGVRDALAGDRAAFGRIVRLIAAEEGGQTVGVRLYGVRPTSLSGVLGFENGDLIVDVNGRTFVTAAAMDEVVAELRTADRLELHVVRRGEPLTIVVSIVETLGAP